MPNGIPAGGKTVARARSGVDNSERIRRFREDRTRSFPMAWTRSLLAIAALWLAGADPLIAQDLPKKNPLEGNPDAIRYGMGQFRSRCADCHGMDAKGVRGPDITQVWASGRTDEG